MKKIVTLASLFVMLSLILTACGGGGSTASDLLGAIEERFDSVTDVKGPVDVVSPDNQIVCESLDETSHFESAVEDILSVYRQVFGKSLDLNERLVPERQQQQ